MALRRASSTTESSAARLMPAERMAMFSACSCETLIAALLSMRRLRNSSRSSLLGRSTQMRLSKRRNRAGSRLLAESPSVSKLVAASTNTGFLALERNPSISVRKAVSTSDAASVRSVPLRRLPMASISSTNRMEGAYLRAVRKISCTACGPSPTNLFKNWLPSACKKVTSDSPAIALASSVLPVPEGRTAARPWAP